MRAGGRPSWRVDPSARAPFPVCVPRPSQEPGAGTSRRRQRPLLGVCGRRLTPLRGPRLDCRLRAAACGSAAGRVRPPHLPVATGGLALCVRVLAVSGTWCASL